MTTAQRDAIVAPADGLIIFNTTQGCPNYRYNNAWYASCGLLNYSISSLNCAGATQTGVLYVGESASGVSFTVPYTGGDGSLHNGQIVASQGVTGLTATLTAGTFNIGSGNLTYTITGTPASSGTPSFDLNIGGQTCTFNSSISLFPSGTVYCSGSPTAVIEVTSSTGKIWMDRNLGASQQATSSTDASSYGDIYQWGRRADGHQCRNSSTTATVSSVDQPSHGNFITSAGDLRSPQNNNL
jgi:hypothetical protein